MALSLPHAGKINNANKPREINTFRSWEGLRILLLLLSWVYEQAGGFARAH